MKTIVKIEIVILVLVLLVGAGMVLVSEGVLELFYDPVVVEPEVPPIPTDPPGKAPAQTPAPAKEEPAKPAVPTREISAEKYFAYDIREDVYLEKRGDSAEKLYPASITKLLTSYVVLQHMDPNETVTVGDALNLVQEDSSIAELAEGDQLTVGQLIAGMMLPSGNDAAQVVAVATGRKLAGSNLPYGGAVEVFVEEMNRQAELLGMENSHFANPDGFHHDDHYTTMDDLVKLCKTVLADPVLLSYVGMDAASVEVAGRTLEWKNTNLLLNAEEALYQPNAMGMKTGYTGAAGNCLISAFFMEDRVFLIGVFGCPAFTEDRYLDTIELYNRL